MKTTRERAADRRQEKLEYVREQVDSGSLVIRSMTDSERRQYPPRPVPERSANGRSYGRRRSTP